MKWLKRYHGIMKFAIYQISNITKIDRLICFLEFGGYLMLKIFRIVRIIIWINKRRLKSVGYMIRRAGLEYLTLTVCSEDKERRKQRITYPTSLSKRTLNQWLAKIVLWCDHIFGIFSNGLYNWIPFGVWIELEIQQTFKSPLGFKPFIVTD